MVDLGSLYRQGVPLEDHIARQQAPFFELLERKPAVPEWMVRLAGTSPGTAQVVEHGFAFLELI